MGKELTTNLQSSVYGDEVLDATAKTIYLETFGPDYDEGMFPPENKGLWTRFLNKLNKDGIDYLTKKCAYKSDEIKITGDVQYLTYEFTKPIEVKTGFQIQNREKVDIISQVKSLKLECDYEFYYRRGHDGPREVKVRGKIIEIK